MLLNTHTITIIAAVLEPLQYSRPVADKSRAPLIRHGIENYQMVNKLY